MNGDGCDNTESNLRFLCPNCHSQTSNFAGNKNKKMKNKKISKRINRRPDKNVLEKVLWEKPTTHIAKEYGVTDKAVEKWVKIYELKKPPRGYWTKFFYYHKLG